MGVCGAGRGHLARHQVGLAHKGGDEACARMFVHPVRVVDLRGAAGLHHHHTVADGHGLALVVRHHHRGGAHLALDLAQLELHLLAQLGVEVGQGFVQQQHGWLDDQRTRQGHALALPARQLARVAACMFLQVHQAQGLGHALLALGLGHLAHLQPKTHVVGHRHVREERVALEHDAQPACVGLGVCDVAPGQCDAAAAHGLEARHHLQGGGLAAARWAQQRDELTFFHRKVHGLHRAGAAIELGHIRELEEGHAWAFLSACLSIDLFLRGQRPSSVKSAGRCGVSERRAPCVPVRGAGCTAVVRLLA